MMIPALPSEPAAAARGVERHPQDGWCLADPAPLSAASERALRCVLRALIPPAPAPHPEDIEARVEHQVRCMMQYMPKSVRLGFVLILHILAWSPVWRFRALGRLSSLSQAEASRILSGIAQSRLLPVRMLMLAPKAIVLSAYFDQDEVHAVLDYEPKGFIRERNARRAQILAEETAFDASEGRKKTRLEVVS